MVTTIGLAVFGYLLLAVAQFGLAFRFNPVEHYAAYAVGIAGATFAYIRALWYAQHDAARSRQWLIGIALVLQLLWLLPIPTLSIDAYSYVVDAATMQAGRSPYLHAVREAGGTPLGAELSRYGWRPVHGTSPYGPAWMAVMRAVAPLSRHPLATVYALKGIALVGVIIAGLLIYAMVEPPVRLVALTALWWNPAVIVEAAGEAHNDALVIVAVLLTIWALQRRWPVVAVGALTIATLLKYTPVLFGLPCLAFAWRAGLLTRRVVAWTVAVAAAISIGLFYAFWAGPATFAGLRRIGYPHVIGSTTGVLVMLLPDTTLAIRLLRLAVLAPTALIVVRATIRVSARPKDLLRACSVIALIYVIISAPLFWAWHMLLPIALLAATRNVTLLCVITVASRLVAPLDLMRTHGVGTWGTEAWITTIVALWVPLVFMLWQWSRPVPSTPIDDLHHIWRPAGVGRGGGMPG